MPALKDTLLVVQGLLIYEQTRIEIDPDESPHSIRCTLGPRSF